MEWGLVSHAGAEDTENYLGLGRLAWRCGEKLKMFHATARRSQRDSRPFLIVVKSSDHV
jgi:hypothetical protein